MAKKINDFQFKQFRIKQQISSMKVGTDGVLLGAWANINTSEKVLDIGAGTGLIALMLAQRTDSCIIDAVEIDQGSYEEAMENIENSPWSKKICLYHSSLQQYCQDANEKYSSILTNPPFFTSGSTSPETVRSQARHNFSLTFEDLLLCSKQLLSEDGTLSLILPAIEGEEFIQQAFKKGLHLSRKTIFYAKAGKKPERLLLEFSFNKDSIILEELVHYNDDGTWTDEYISLTKDFYLKI